MNPMILLPLHPVSQPIKIPQDARIHSRHPVTDANIVNQAKQRLINDTCQLITEGVHLKERGLD